MADAAKLDAERKQTQATQIATEAKRVAELQRFAANSLQANPAAAPQIIGILQQRRAMPVFGDQLPATAGELATYLHAASSSVLGAPSGAGIGLDEIGKQVVQDFGLQPGTPEFRAKALELRKIEEEQKLSRAKAGATTVYTGEGGIGLTQTARSGQQKEVIEKDTQIRQLNAIEDAIKKVGGYDAYGSGTAALMQTGRELGQKWLNMSVNREAMQKRTAVTAAIGDFSNTVIKQLSGANVTDHEMARMRQSMPLPDDSGPVLQEKVAFWRRAAEQMRNYGVDTLVNGLHQEGFFKPGQGAASPAVQTSAPPPAASQTQPDTLSAIQELRTELARRRAAGE